MDTGSLQFTVCGVKRVRCDVASKPPPKTYAYIIKYIAKFFWTNCHLLDQLRKRKIKVVILSSLIPSSILFLFFFFVDFKFNLCYFLNLQSTSCNISYKAGLLATNAFSFCLFKKILIFSFTFEGQFHKPVIIGWLQVGVFIYQHFKYFIPLSFCLQDFWEVIPNSHLWPSKCKVIFWFYFFQDLFHLLFSVVWKWYVRV